MSGKTYHIKFDWVKIHLEIWCRWVDDLNEIWPKKRTIGGDISNNSVVTHAHGSFMHACMHYTAGASNAGGVLPRTENARRHAYHQREATDQRKATTDCSDLRSTSVSESDSAHVLLESRTRSWSSESSDGRVQRTASIIVRHEKNRCM